MHNVPHQGILAKSRKAAIPPTSVHSSSRTERVPHFLQIASMSSVFLLSSDYYDEAGHISIHATSPTGLVFAKVPIQFLRKGGLNTWDFVLAITNMLVDPVPSCPGTIRTTTGNPIDITSVPTDGDYVYIQEGKVNCQLNSWTTLTYLVPGSMMPIKYSRGPDYKSQRRPAGSDQDSLSSSSDGSSNASQVSKHPLRIKAIT